jgi:hypothetical protein
MTKSKFEKLIHNRGYRPSDVYQRKDRPDFKVWSKNGSNILLEVRRMTYARVIRFKSGRFGYVEALPFSKHNQIF